MLDSSINSIAERGTTLMNSSDDDWGNSEQLLKEESRSPAVEVKQSLHSFIALK